MVGKASISVDSSEAMRFIQLLKAQDYDTLHKMYVNNKIAFYHVDKWTVFYFDIDTWMYLYDNI